MHNTVNTRLAVYLPEGDILNIDCSELSTFGRSPDNTVVLNDSSVSAQHAELRLVNGHFWLKDLNSSNGTQVNGVRIKEVEVLPGDRLQFGRIFAVFSPDAQSSSPASASQASAAKTFSGLNIRFANALADLKSPEFKRELLPFNASSLASLKSTPRFWLLLLLATGPTTLPFIGNNLAQLALMSLLLAVAWALVFKESVLLTRHRWKPAVLSALFSGIVGNTLLLALQKLLWANYPEVAGSSNQGLSWAGNMLQVGFCTQLVVLLPVTLYLLTKRRNAAPDTALLIGAFSGIGLAAMGPAILWLGTLLGAVRIASSELTHLPETAFASSIALNCSLFSQLVFGAIMGVLAATALRTGKRLIALLLCGLVVTSLLHGLYAWATRFHLLAAAGAAAVAYVVFYAYFQRLDGACDQKPTDL